MYVCCWGAMHHLFSHMFPCWLRIEILPEQTVCPSQLPYCLDKMGANWREREERCHPCGVSTCCRWYCFSYSPSIMSHPCCVCECVFLHAFKGRLYVLLVHVHKCGRVSFGGGRFVIVLRWLEPSSGAVSLITVEQSPLISHCSLICLLQTSNLQTEPSIIFLFHISTAAP